MLTVIIHNTDCCSVGCAQRYSRVRDVSERKHSHNVTLQGHIVVGDWDGYVDPLTSDECCKRDDLGEGFYTEDRCVSEQAIATW